MAEHKFQDPWSCALSKHTYIAHANDSISGNALCISLVDGEKRRILWKMKVDNFNNLKNAIVYLISIISKDLFSSEYQYIKYETKVCENKSLFFKLCYAII